MIYFHSSRHVPAAEAGLNPTDPALKIDWPLPVGKTSDRDAGHPLIDDNFSGVAP